MTDEVKLYGLEGSPFDWKVQFVLNLKGIKYEYFPEDLENKSADLIKYNPVHKKIPVLVHNGNPIAESLVIMEYIDEVWKGASVLPRDAYGKAQARFWAKFIDDTCVAAVFKAVLRHGEAQAVVEAHKQLQFLENELNLKGNKFFGGDNIDLVDIAAAFLAFWLGAAEEALGITVMDEDKFPKLNEWAGNFINCQGVKDLLPSREMLVAFYKLKL